MEFLAIAILAFAFWVKATIGFGSGLIAIPLLALFIAPSDAITLVLIFALGDVPLVWVNRHKVSWGLLKKILPGAIFGCVIGTLAQAYLPGEIVRKVLGVLILMYVLKSVYFPAWGQAGIHKFPKVLTGGLGGFINGGFGVGGPIFVMFYREVIKNQAVFRATLLATFFFTNVVRVFVSAPVGLINEQVLSLALYGLVPFFAAIYIGQRYHARVSKRVFMYGVNTLLTLAGLGLLL